MFFVHVLTVVLLENDFFVVLAKERFFVREVSVE